MGAAGVTAHYGLRKLNTNEPFSTNGQQFTLADRDEIDRLLYMGAQGHHHNGAGISQANPNAAGTIQVGTSGTIPAGLTANYEYTWVDSNGFETAPSPIASTTLPAQLPTLGAPALVPDTSTGTLPPGPYFYALTAYTNNVNTQETALGVMGTATLSSNGNITINFPTLPAGTTGVNIYRRDPAGTNFLYITSVPISGGTPTSFQDTGSIAENCNRFGPNTNTSNGNNSITFTLPVAVPAGFTWNLYRSFNVSDWSSSLLASITQTSGGSVVTSFVDTGIATQGTQPPVSTELISSPSKVLMTGGAEVQGLLPASMIDFTNANLFPFAVSFAFAGSVVPTTGTTCWVNPFPNAVIVSAQASLGRSSSPASQPVIADVLKGTGQNPTYTSIYSGATPNPKPQVNVGKQVGNAAPPNITSLAAGDSLSVDIDQAGGGATPTDHDLTVTIYLLVGTPGASTTSPIWAFQDITTASATLAAGVWAVCSPLSGTTALNLPANPGGGTLPIRVEFANNSSGTTTLTVQTTDGSTITYSGAVSASLTLTEQGVIRDFTWDSVNSTWRVS